ncbi:MAG: metallophosphoesterase family protein [Chloroflexi bacterium]|nr:metallophosphoesterase family protein [Chloroflexota bacterium]
MRIGVIADTHIQSPGERMPDAVLRIFRGVELILHCGDIYHISCLDQLETLAPVFAVRGYPDPRVPDPRLAEPTRIVEAGGLRIGMVHDIGWPGPRIKADQTLELPDDEPVPDVLRRKFGGPVHIVAFGDTHEELVETHSGILFVNPGSPTYPGVRHPLGDLGTVAILEVVSGQAHAEIVKLRP